eukprot:TRINITY_DN13476_c0_g1_i1.p1 TRINITY_DN13476_c0_g1~~TRINITY_DN13476_c0_g1_i1.p1  ORF type:complete len:470 (-),score=83.59 TRINITY_DN13476_c0_g1_i1:122-1531(-)
MSTPTSTSSSSSKDNEKTRQMYDKRELRRMFKARYMEKLDSWRKSRLRDAVTMEPETVSRVQVFLRKRPLFEYEAEADEFDVVSVRGGVQVVVHSCLTKADLKSLYIHHQGFQFHHAFDERASDEDVYHQCAFSAVEHVRSGKVATLFMFGQTGSGKTHTMHGVVERAASHLFAGCDTSYHVSAFEIAGKSMRDLLCTDTARELRLLDDKSNRTRVVGAAVLEAKSSDELLEAILESQTRRATKATQANDTSSRSHAVYQVAGPRGALLTLVDCAGSERREDTTQHDAQQQKEAAEINATIFALKECFRVMRAPKGGQQPPYRSSLLTRVLSDSFGNPDARVVAIGTVSPSASDTEHCLSTVRSLMELQGSKLAFEEKEDIVRRRVVEPHPRTWTEAAVKQWLESAANGAAKRHVARLTKGTDGKNLIRWPVQRFAQLCEGNAILGQKLFEELRLRMHASGTTATDGGA